MDLWMHIRTLQRSAAGQRALFMSLSVDWLIERAGDKRDGEGFPSMALNEPGSEPSRPAVGF
eukprot:5266724-Pleurochrysis_carterae.AAC.1